MKAWLEEHAGSLIQGLAQCWQCPIGAKTEKGLNLAGQKAVNDVLNDFISILFPGCHGHETVEDSLQDFLKERLGRAGSTLKEQIRSALEYQCTVDHGRECKDCDNCDSKAKGVVIHLMENLSDVQRILQRDITAAYEGDPAARSAMEIVMSYPGVYAVIIHRIAHVLYTQEVPLIPRIMSEYAHSQTGIDIHPGATIGPGFFIDHGTGVVIGETTTIGENVKLYQGVTLGALSFEKDADGNPVKGIKRHPDVGDNVVVYAGATILGGRTTIGDGAEIGGNVWLTHSIPPKSKVYNKQPRPTITGSEITMDTEGDGI
jgi:serine O-acetyltransferase